MIKVAKHKLRTNKEGLDRLHECNRVSAMIWNACLEHAREHHIETGEWINKADLQSALKKKFPLHSQCIQAVVDKYLFARAGACAARKKGYNTRYPHRSKNVFPTKWKKDGFKIGENGKIELSMGIWEGKRQKPIVVRVKEIPQGVIKEIELIWDNGLCLAICYEDGLESKENNSDTIAAIDLGEIHAIAAVEEKGDAIIITGRKLRSIKRLRNKKHKELNKKIARAKKGSRRCKKLRRAKRKISSKTEAQQKDLLHKTSRSFVKWAMKNEVGTVVVGDVEGVQRNTANKKRNPKKKRRGRKLNQKLSQWPFGLLLMYLTYKLAMEGISLVKITEEYTSQTCPVCGRRKKVSGRVYSCYCGYREHRDIHGARNILAKYKYGKICDTKIEISAIKYLRPVASAAKSSRCPEPGL